MWCFLGMVTLTKTKGNGAFSGAVARKSGCNTLRALSSPGNGMSGMIMEQMKLRVPQAGANCKV